MLSSLCTEPIIICTVQCDGTLDVDVFELQSGGGGGRLKFSVSTSHDSTSAAFHSLVECYQLSHQGGPSIASILIKDKQQMVNPGILLCLSLLRLMDATLSLELDSKSITVSVPCEWGMP